MPMRIVLLTADECGICDAAKAAFEKRFVKNMIRGEAAIINLDTDEAYQEKWAEHELELAPVVLLEDGEGNIISTIPPEELLDYKLPAETEQPAEEKPAPPEAEENKTLTNPT
ncbi:MAG: hypothetical protein PHI12_12220 [Dehalococcoidales bacterium]|nr:hypothetical protein [Dehalococcoidales bacterium]